VGLGKDSGSPVEVVDVVERGGLSEAHAGLPDVLATVHRLHVLHRLLCTTTQAQSESLVWIKLNNQLLVFHYITDMSRSCNSSAMRHTLCNNVERLRANIVALAFIYFLLMAFVLVFAC